LHGNASAPPASRVGPRPPGAQRHRRSGFLDTRAGRRRRDDRNGEAGEKDYVGSTFENVRGGSGNDVLINFSLTVARTEAWRRKVSSSVRA
jgi:hypothetical protein